MNPPLAEPGSPQDASPESQKYTSTTVSWDDILEVIYPNLLLGCALIVSATVQARTFGLSIYHALIVLNLSWIIILSAAPTFMTIDNYQPLSTDLDRLRHRTWGFMAIWYTLYLTLTAAFGLWFFATIAHFDRTDAECKPLTLYYALGKYVHADNPAFRHFWIAMYSLVVIPVSNYLFVGLVFALAFVASVFAAVVPTFLALTIFGGCTYCFGSTSVGVFEIEVLFNGIPAFLVLIPSVIMVVVTEKMIAINTVGVDEKLWTFGQTLALMIALPPTLVAAKQAKKTFSNIGKMIRVRNLIYVYVILW